MKENKFSEVKLSYISGNPDQKFRFNGMENLAEIFRNSLGEDNASMEKGLWVIPYEEGTNLVEQILLVDNSSSSLKYLTTHARRRLFGYALNVNAYTLILVSNHPNKNLNVDEDEVYWRKLKDLGLMFNLRFCYRLAVSPDDFRIII